MELHVIGSGSKGNAYILRNNDEALLLELGMKFKYVKQALNFEVNKIIGALVSHSHADHAGYMEEYLKEGVEVFTTLELKERYSQRYANISHAAHNIQFTIGHFRILPFELVHDVLCNGYLIQHPDCGKVLFITDTHYSHYRFNDVNHFIIEANYSEKIIRHNLDAGVIDRSYYERVLRSHMSIETAIELLSINQAQKARTITLTHLSDGNSDAKAFQKQVIRAFGIPVTIAEAGKVIHYL